MFATPANIKTCFYGWNWPMWFPFYWVWEKTLTKVSIKKAKNRNYYRHLWATWISALSANGNVLIPVIIISQVSSQWTRYKGVHLEKLKNSDIWEISFSKIFEDTTKSQIYFQWKFFVEKLITGVSGRTLFGRWS